MWDDERHDGTWGPASVRKVPYEISRQMGKSGREKRKGDREGASRGRRSSMGRSLKPLRERAM